MQVERLDQDLNALIKIMYIRHMLLNPFALVAAQTWFFIIFHYKAILFACILDVIYWKDWCMCIYSSNWCSVSLTNTRSWYLCSCLVSLQNTKEKKIWRDFYLGALFSPFFLHRFYRHNLFYCLCLSLLLTETCVLHTEHSCNFFLLINWFYQVGLGCLMACRWTKIWALSLLEWQPAWVCVLPSLCNALRHEQFCFFAIFHFCYAVSRWL